MIRLLTFLMGLMLIFVGCDTKQNRIIAKPNSIESDSLSLSMPTDNLLDSLFQDNNVVEINCPIPQEIMPVFPGGGEGLANFVKKNTHFPATKADITGVVYVGFTIQNDGNVTEVKVIKGIQEDFDAEAVRVVKKMPRWKPGTRNGRTVATRYTVPIRFTLDSVK